MCHDPELTIIIQIPLGGKCAGTGFVVTLAVTAQ
eukprot:CAMPEP_0180658810 /NCGR_PEP_ID=MMETSP1037_2-20121125/57217_1 /TAXON_ID=632150 /ORGANISM="Azadinium spinosum, Strain 3D9" /LENGTH=33 /DNA_ID= /DNA_START= /DNA_END= /DNA_ORIENTATION=